MIIFKGQITDENIKYIVKGNKKIATLVMLVISLILLVPIIISIFKVHWAMSLCIIPLIIFVAFAGIPPKDLSIITPIEIFIEENEMKAMGKTFAFFSMFIM